jgi:hypothetical protein
VKMPRYIILEDASRGFFDFALWKLDPKLLCFSYVRSADAARRPFDSPASRDHLEGRLCGVRKRGLVLPVPSTYEAAYAQSRAYATFDPSLRSRAG